MVKNKDIRKLFEEFIAECEFTEKLRPETLRGYRATFELFFKLMPALTLGMINPTTMSDFFKQLQQRERVVGRGTRKRGVKISTVATYRSKLNSFFEWLRVRKLIKENPFRQMPYPSPNYEDRKFLKKEQVERILTALVTYSWENNLVQKRNLTIFYILLCCGLRKGELLGLKVLDIDLSRKQLTVRAETSKSKRERVLPINSKTLMVLEDYLQERNQAKYSTPYLLVSNNRDDRLTRDGLKHLVAKLNDFSGIHFHPHQFRHTFGVNLASANINIGKLQQLMGHKDIRMTQAYLRVIPTDQMRSDVEILRVENLV